MRNEVLKEWVKKATSLKKHNLIKRYERYITDLNKSIEEIKQREITEEYKYTNTLEQLIREVQVKIEIIKQHDITKSEIEMQYAEIKNRG